MITFFSDFAKSWGAKIILGVLLISMIAFWGLGGLMNTSLSNNGTAIKVGSKSVSMKELSNAFETDRQRMSAMMGGQYLSPKQALEGGLLNRVIQSKVIELVQAGVKDKLGLTASDNAVRKYVERNPAFLDALGNFDRNIFYAYLAQAKVSEGQLAEQLKNELAMQHLNATVIDLGYNPTVLAELMYRFNNEKRTIVGALIEPQNVKISKQPTEDELKEYYEAYGENFILPEYRTVSAVIITPDKMTDKVIVSDQDIDEVYEARKGTFGTPETRQIEQMLFQDEAAAKAAKQGLTAANFQQVAKDKAGQSAQQTNFGWTSKDEMMTELAEPVFASSKGAIVGPINSPLGWHLLLVKDIKAGTTPSVAQIKADIKKQLASDKTYGTMEEMTRKLEDALGAGETLETAAKNLGLTVQKIGTFDVTGHKQDGSSLPDDYKSGTLIQNVFTLPQGEASSVMEYKNGYIIAQVDDVIASKPQEYADAKPALAKLWRAEQQKAQLQSTVDEIVNRAQKGTSLQTQGVFDNFKSFIERDVTRTKVEKLPVNAIAPAFAQEPGLANTQAIPMNNGIFVMTVDRVIPADPAKDSLGLNVEKQNLKMQIGEGLANEVMGAYAEKFGVKVNQAEIEKAFSVYTTGNE